MSRSPTAARGVQSTKQPELKLRESEEKVQTLKVGSILAAKTDFFSGLHEEHSMYAEKTKRNSSHTGLWCVMLLVLPYRKASPFPFVVDCFCAHIGVYSSCCCLVFVTAISGFLGYDFLIYPNPCTCMYIYDNNKLSLYCHIFAAIPAHSMYMTVAADE